jgi:hypothetical protein
MFSTPLLVASPERQIAISNPRITQKTVANPKEKKVGSTTDTANEPTKLQNKPSGIAPLQGLETLLRAPTAIL